VKNGIIALAGVLALATAAAAQIRGGTVIDGKGVGMGTVEKSRAEIIREKQRAYRSAIRRAHDSMKSKNWGTARECVDSAVASITSASQLKEIQSLLLKLQVEGDTQLKDARRLYETGKYPEALRGYRRVANQFGKLPCARRARELVKAAATDPTMKAAMNEDRAAVINEAIERIISPNRPTARPAGKTLAGSVGTTAKVSTTKVPSDDQHDHVAKTAGGGGADKVAAVPSDDQHDGAARGTQSERASKIKKLSPEKQARVLDMLLRIVKYYGETPTGKRAEKDLAALRGDKEFMTLLARAKLGQDARKALARAESYRKAGMHVKAALLYKDVIDKFPGTAEAGKAAVRIAEPLPRS